ncbi:MAG: HEAT repeat domain-containing protein [Candidatus Riflebacteria bacterium]|nr:HEAT repeat domain-containing protein [Candidatus Riflebacteria bacterium]
MINALLILLAALIVIVLVFIIFTQDDQEDGPPEALKAASDLSASNNDVESSVNVSSETSKDVSKIDEERPLKPIVPPLDYTGTAEDLKLRLLMDDKLAPLTEVKTVQNVVAAVVQLRFPKELLSSGTNALAVLKASEAILQPRSSLFQYSVYFINQMDRLWLFGFDEELDDPVFEALVSAMDAISKFKKALESNEALKQANARISVGMSFGEVARTVRGTFGPTGHCGMPVYMAEVLAESAGDFMIHVDDQVHNQAMPFFDFREWRPIKLRHVLPPTAFFEVMGLNKKEELFAFASHQEAKIRRCVAVAYRYLDITEMAPLFGLITDSDDKVALEALASVSEIGDEKALGILKRILPETQKPILKSAIIEAMGKIAREDILPLLLASTKDTNWQVRYNAAKSLFRVAGGDSVKHLDHLLKDDNAAVRALVNGYFFQHTASEKHLLSLKELLSDLSVRGRRSAIEALCEIGTPQAVYAISESWQNQEQEVQTFILRKLVNVNSPVLYQAFLSMFKNADEKGRSQISSAMRRAGIGVINAN